MKLKGKKILLGVTGGIAAYKSPSIVSLLKKQGAEVKVVMTEGATQFVTPLTFQTMSANAVHCDMFKAMDHMDVEHIALAKWADMIVIAPATENTIAKFAYGIADNLLSTVLQASRSKVMVVPAMNTFMLESPANRQNMATLKERGVIVTDTQRDLLACNDVGSGKMLEPAEIVDLIDFHLREKDLAEYIVTVTAGPTQEAVDPVRYLTNHSSGKMGYHLATAAAKRGAKVNLISGPTALSAPAYVNFVPVVTTQDMFDAVGAYFDETDVLIKAAAPADFKPASYSAQKVKKDSDMSSLQLVKNPDIAKHFGAKKTDQVLVGFAAESQNEIAFGRGKLEKKHLDMIVINNITAANAGFQKDVNTVTILHADGAVDEPGTMSKEELAEHILDQTLEILKAR
ncbi:bifunctional phosphopantothenoylcysteine decarboxylase/phosphopantothenate--cysteine ligase CoaBC [Peptoniphilus equinus]|uniref:Coenzyme A biosynthesis bifunctional protein CoaBC n=1 Tax=Peptoniphilus equinus TaxID=3016343 RepID=A0ABY7QTP2_9FIRM|nr:bifunctional phosphopantothenoylcysteine decarboxylase/phosphopantothenate--cysteine ligase CoaBC [Peptoniphilus equinus]WBW49258.1 bifunctional phosphopantothenoylcysteine decarboxylase/phosphopantothenate--cysteine ligase CoaBC [Peptoniphilus equinus]